MSHTLRADGDVPTHFKADPATAERLVAEGLIDLPEAAKLFPPCSGRTVAFGSLWRWIVRGKGGIRLEGIRFHDEWWTSRAAVGRFLAAVTEAWG